MDAKVNEMKCSKCCEEGLKSLVYPGLSSTTALWCPPFYDEQGKEHVHDSNWTTTTYTCSLGHQWKESHQGSCWCGWPNKEQKMSDEVQEKPNFEKVVIQGDGGKWLMEIHASGKVKFNREEFPDMAEDEFAAAVMKIMEDQPWKSS